MEILQEIIDMDKAAAARAFSAVEEARRLSDESGEQSAKESREMLSAERAKVQDYCKSQEQRLSEMLRRAESVREEGCKKLDESFNSNKARWKSEILDRITGGK